MSDRSVTLSTTLLGLAATLTLAPATNAQAKNDAQVRADIEYARGLAQRFRYVDLAEEVLGGLESSGAASSMAAELALAKCDVYAEGAKRESDKAERNALYDKALEAYVDFLDDFEFADERPQAERGFIDLSTAYALILERDLEELVGEDAEAARARMRQVLEDAVERTSDMLDVFGPSTELSTSEKEEKWRLMLNMGQLRILQGKQAESGTFMFGEADAILEELAFDAGETSGWGLNAYLLMAKSKLAQEEFYDAAAFAEYVVDLVIPLDEETREFQGWDEIPQELRQARWEMVERATPDLLEAYTKAGDLKAATDRGLGAYNRWKQFGFALTPRGSLAMLALGNALVDSGGWVGGSTTQGNLAWFETEEAMESAGFSGRRDTRRAVDMALSIAQDVNKENKGNILQVYAQQLIKRVRDVPGIQLDPGILYEAAEGTYYERDYPEAVEAMKGVVASLQTQDEATRREFMPKVLYFTGQAYARMDRNLEAALTHREALESWNGDPTFDPQNARFYLSNVQVVRRGADEDPLLRQLLLDAENKVQQYGNDEGGDILWRQAERAYDQDDFAGAREKYLQVEPSSDDYERAVVKAALCLYKMGDTERAAEEFAKYVDEYVKDPANTPSTGPATAARAQARAQAVYYLGKMAFDAGDYDTVVARMQDFDEEFPGQDSYGAAALYMVVVAHLESERFDEARAIHATMTEKFESQSVTGRGALLIFVAMDEKLKRLVAQDAEQPAVRELERDMAEMLRLSNGLDATPAYGNLRRETELWLALDEWAEAERAARRTLEVHTDRQEDLEKYVVPDLGHAVLKQKRVAEAFEILDPIVPDPDGPTKGQPGPVEDWCHAVAGWVEGSGSQIVEVPGVGGKENFEKATKHWQSLESLAEAKFDKWTCEWFAVKFDRAYCYYQYGQLDSSFLDVTKSQIEYLTSELAAGLSDITGRCGDDDTLERRFRWLESKLP